jgi:hypothetical protein
MIMAAQASGASVRGFTIALAVWVLVLELTQCWIDTRSGEISTPLLALLSGLLVAAIGPATRQGNSAASPASRPNPRTPDARAHPTGQPRPWHKHPAWTLSCLLVPMTMALHLGLRLPGLPYNVRELFVADGHVAALATFAAALLWLGAGPAWLGRLLSASKHPWLWLPIGGLTCALVALALLTASTTSESLDDIAGSNNIMWFVTQRDLWGAWWRELFLRLDAPTLIAFIERCVRWAALYGPLPLVLATLVALARRDSLGPGRHWRTVTMLLSVALTLWLCKAIAFDWSSTDNLNELIARDGPWGLGGGGWLYALLVGICANALLLAHGLTRGLLPMLGTVVATAVALPAGWWLLSAGLDPSVEKYGHVFSGAQFLLGPDRQQLLPDSVLQMRWFGVQMAIVTIIAMGIWLERRIAAWQTPSRQLSS